MTEEQSTIYVGIDVSKDKLAVAIAGGGSRDEILRQNNGFPNRPMTQNERGGANRP